MTIYNGATWRPVTNQSSPTSRNHGQMTHNLGLILHVQQGNNSPYGWFQNPESEASAHFWISKRGTVEQFVSTGIRAWAQGDGNDSYCSVETEGYPQDPLTLEQVNALARLYAWGHRVHGWSYLLAEAPNQHGFGWHGMGGSGYGGHPNCPGVLRRAQRRLILDRAAAFASPPTTTPQELDMTDTELYAVLLRLMRDRTLVGNGKGSTMSILDALNHSAVFAERAATPAA